MFSGEFGHFPDVMSYAHMVKSRDKIITACGELLFEGKKLAIADIVERARVSVGTVYNNFGDLDGLVDEVHYLAFVNILEDNVSRICEVLLSGVADPRPLVRAILEDGMAPANDRARILRFSAMATYGYRPELASRIRRFQRELVDDLEIAMRPWAGAHSRLAAATGLGLMAGSPLSIAEPTEAEREAVVNLVLRFIFEPETVLTPI